MYVFGHVDHSIGSVRDGLWRDKTTKRKSSWESVAAIQVKDDGGLNLSSVYGEDNLKKKKEVKQAAFCDGLFMNDICEGNFKMILRSPVWVANIDSNNNSSNKKWQ